MSDFDAKLSNLTKAIDRLQTSIEEYNEFQLLSSRDGAIQRFEFTTELAWKTTREYLLDQGFSDINSPKAVMREAFAYHVINDEQAWVKILTDRNATTHIYKEELAAEIFERILTTHLKAFKELSAFFSN